MFSIFGVPGDRQVPRLSVSRRSSRWGTPALQVGSVLLLAIAAALPGCGASSDGAHIKGKVTVNGQPLPADAIGTVTFQTTTPGKGRMVSGPIENSAFDIPSAPVGALKAYFTVQQPTGRTIDNGRGTPAQEFKTMISDKYAAGIDVQVDGSNDALDFALDGA